jgi:purine-binding chemotaxis protein CheW
MSTVKPERDDPRGRAITPERARRDAYRSLVGFVVGKVSYAVPTNAVREITTPAAVTELPHLPHGVIGVFDHRGLVVPVIDLRTCFGVTGEAARSRSQWIIVDAGQHRIGLVVNRVTGVFEVGFGGLKPVPEMGKPIDPRNLVGVTTHYEQMTFVLDVGAFHAYTLDLPIAELPAG